MVNFHTPKRTLTIDMVGEMFVIDEPTAPGSPAVGYGKTMMEAIGNWFHNNQTKLGFSFDVQPAAQAAEIERRKSELAKR